MAEETLGKKVFTNPKDLTLSNIREMIADGDKLFETKKKRLKKLNKVKYGSPLDEKPTKGGKGWDIAQIVIDILEEIIDAFT